MKLNRFSAALLLLALPAAAQGAVLRVKSNNAPGSAPDGASWASAFTTLQAALAVANANPATPYEIWVAKGAYHPYHGSDPTNNRDKSFRIARNNVQLYGGFSGAESARSQRNWAANPTILSGDIDGDDSNSDGNFIAETWDDIQGNNAWHILWLDGVTNGPITSSTVIDGFIITAGYASDIFNHHSGGGLYCDGGGSGNECSPTLSNVIFSGNLAGGAGGAMLNSGDGDGTSNPRLSNAVLSGNSAASGGAMLNSGNSSPALVNVTFSGNEADEGGGMANIDSDSKPTLVNAIFWGNAAAVGVQIYNDGAVPAISFSLVQGGCPAGAVCGGGMLAADPLFVNAGLGNLRLRPGSPAIDAGSNAALPTGLTADLDGKTRIAGGSVDIGAYEYGSGSLAPAWLPAVYKLLIKH